MIDWNLVLQVLLFITCGTICIEVGFVWGYIRCENKYEEAKKVRKQQEVWNEYIELLKGGQNGK